MPLFAGAQTKVGVDPPCFAQGAEVLRGGHPGMPAECQRWFVEVSGAASILNGPKVACTKSWSTSERNPIGSTVCMASFCAKLPPQNPHTNKGQLGTGRWLICGNEVWPYLKQFKDDELFGTELSQLSFKRRGKQLCCQQALARRLLIMDGYDVLPEPQV